MDTMQPNSDYFDENQSLQVIREMIQVSQKKLKNDGILFILWGWLMFYNYISIFILEKIIITYQIKKILDYFGTVIGISAIAFSIYYILKQRKKVQTYIGISLRYIWISLVVCLSLTNMIIFNVIHKAYFELQHPIFMMFIAFATVTTGGIIRYKLIIFGGVIFGILAYSCSFFNLQVQMLFEAAAWLIAFIIPGHILYLNRNR
jgi:hypothetical protein